MIHRLIIVTAIIALLACAACSRSRVEPRIEAAVAPPNEILDFKVLYAQNCAGCHGADGKGGAALSLADPVFLAITDDSVIRRVASNGMPGTPMPAFAQTSGGMLSQKQIDALVHGIRSWAKTNGLDLKASLPSYQAQSTGNPQRGAEAYQTFCFSCHGANGRGGKAGSIVDGSYLALSSNQDLRLSVIMGRPAQGAPDWRGDVPGRPMSEQEITDIVAWLVAQRPAIPGQPYSEFPLAQAKEGPR
jgi:cytochrome c oxidase cbb3-type subunit 3